MNRSLVRSLPLVVAVAGCGGQIDAGSDVLHGSLPAASGRPKLVGVVVN